MPRTSAQAQARFIDTQGGEPPKVTPTSSHEETYFSPIARGCAMGLCWPIPGTSAASKVTRLIQRCPDSSLSGYD
jgi:hypothetical protein